MSQLPSNVEPNENELSTPGKPSRFSDFVNWWRLRAVRLADPETIVSTIVVAVLGLLAGIGGGIVGMLIVLVVVLAIHMVTVESGHYLMLWLATSMLLLLILLAFATIFPTVPAVLWAVGGAIALAYNELVRINFARRRQAIIDQSVFSSSTIGVGAATLIGMIATGVAQVLGSGSDRNWLWIVLAFFVVSLIGLAIAIVPVRNATAKDKERFQPGERIPPQPLAKESIADL